MVPASSACHAGAGRLGRARACRPAAAAPQGTRTCRGRPGRCPCPTALLALEPCRAVPELVGRLRVSPARCGKLLGHGVSSRPSAFSSSIAASHWFWCIVSRAIMKRSMSRTPASSVMLNSRVTWSRPCDSAVTLKRKSASRLPLATCTGVPAVAHAVGRRGAARPETMACCGFIAADHHSSRLPPRTAPTSDFGAASLGLDRRLPAAGRSWSRASRLCDLLRADIQQHVAVLHGPRQFQPWNR